MRSILLAGTVLALSSVAAFAQSANARGDDFLTSFDGQPQPMAISLELIRAADYRLTPIKLGKWVVTSAGGAAVINPQTTGPAYALTDVTSVRLAADADAAPVAAELLIRGYDGGLGVVYVHEVLNGSGTIELRSVDNVNAAPVVFTPNVWTNSEAGALDDGTIANFETIANSDGEQDVLVQIGGTLQFPPRMRSGRFVGLMTVVIEYDL